MSRWLQQFRETNPDIHGRAISANSANRSDEGAIGTIGTIGTGVERDPWAPENDKAMRAAGTVAWDAEDWRAFHYERAGIAEDNGLPREKADARAFEWTLVEWMNRNPLPSEPGRCAWCGEPEGTGDAMVVPYGTEPHGHTWLHSWCWPAWQTQRRREAADALAEVGIQPPEPRPA